MQHFALVSLASGSAWTRWAEASATVLYYQYYPSSKYSKRDLEIRGQSGGAWTNHLGTMEKIDEVVESISISQHDCGKMQGPTETHKRQAYWDLSAVVE